MALGLEAQKCRFSWPLATQIPRGFMWDRLPSTAGSAPTTNVASARNATSRPFARRSGHKIVAVFKETASGADDDRPERKKVMALARAREIEAILVTELSRWG